MGDLENIQMLAIMMSQYTDNPVVTTLANDPLTPDTLYTGTDGRVFVVHQ